jgi:alanine racemase
VIIQHLLLDSRKLQQASSGLFFALRAAGRMGSVHGDLVDKGLTNFVITQSEWIDKYPKVNFILVKDSIAALQKLAGYHRKKYNFLPLIDITGSNGKTIIKEWLYQLLSEDYNSAKP